MRYKPPKIEMRIINVTFPRFVIVDRRRYWTGKAGAANCDRPWSMPTPIPLGTISRVEEEQPMIAAKPAPCAETDFA